MLLMEKADCFLAFREYVHDSVRRSAPAVSRKLNLANIY